MGLIEVVLIADAGAALPQTGRAVPLLAAGIAIGVALLLRVGGSRLGAGDDRAPERASDETESPADRPPDC